MNVVLIGMKHCGNSTLGAALAERWGCPFYDVDRMIEDTYACESDRQVTVRELFAAEGEQCFRRIEGEVVCQLYMSLNRPDSTAVVAVGGQTATNDRVCTRPGDYDAIKNLIRPGHADYTYLKKYGLRDYRYHRLHVESSRRGMSDR